MTSLTGEAASFLSGSLFRFGFEHAGEGSAPGFEERSVERGLCRSPAGSRPAGVAGPGSRPANGALDLRALRGRHAVAGEDQAPPPALSSDLDRLHPAFSRAAGGDFDAPGPLEVHVADPGLPAAPAAASLPLHTVETVFGLEPGAAGRPARLHPADEPRECPVEAARSGLLGGEGLPGGVREKRADAGHPELASPAHAAPYWYRRTVWAETYPAATAQYDFGHDTRCSPSDDTPPVERGKREAAMPLRAYDSGATRDRKIGPVVRVPIPPAANAASPLGAI